MFKTRMERIYMEELEFYAIEGLDGVGKTTLGINIRNLGYNVYKTPDEEFSCLRRKLHSLNKSSLFFYLSSLAFLFEKRIKNKNNIPFFVDRYLFSTISEFSYKNKLSINEVNWLFETFYNFLPKPKLTIFLVLDYEKRIERIKKREIASEFDNLKKDYDKYINRMIYSYQTSPKVIIKADKEETYVLEEVLRKISFEKGGDSDQQRRNFENDNK